MPRMLAHRPADVTVLDVIPEPSLPRVEAQRPVRWRLRTRIAFRLYFRYSGLYVVLVSRGLNWIQERKDRKSVV